MQKTHCRDCGATELYDTVLSARNGVIIGRKVRTGDEWILVRCLICLNCGFIMPYLSDDGLERLRTWAVESLEAQDPGIAMAQAAGQAAPDAPTTSMTASAAPAPETSDSNPAPRHEGHAGFGTIVIACLILGTILGIAVVVYSMMHD
jgi:hypothetical protein